MWFLVIWKFRGIWLANDVVKKPSDIFSKP